MESYYSWKNLFRIAVPPSKKTTTFGGTAYRKIR
jgi:hypothetical protein